MFGSELTFGAGATDVAIERRAVSASLEMRVGDANTFSFGAGAGVGGLLSLGGERHTISPGWLVTAAYSRRLLDGRGALPFLLLGVSAGGSGASTHAAVVHAMGPPATAALYAVDIRAGLTVGKTFWDILSPYLGVRAFGGPVIWSIDGATRSGTDQHHFQIAAGLLTSLPGGFDLYAEVAPFGERAVTLGGGLAF